MARARRAKPRRSRALVGLIVVAVLAGGAVAALRFWPESLTAIGSPPPTAGTRTSSAASSAEPTAAPPTSATPSPSAKATKTPATAGAVQAMESCRKRVQAADAVLERAQTGISHWQAHVAAERDAAAGRISDEDQQAIFKATRLKGGGDQNRYAAAQRAYDRVRDASCGKAEGADAEVADTLATCRKRALAQGPMMTAAARAMGDWTSHLAAMQRSREIHVENAQQIWIDAYRAAPRNISAYETARRAFDPPRC